MFLFSDATAYSNAYFGQGNGSVVLDDVTCVGNESRLVGCQYTANNDCTHSEDAGISCKAECKCMIMKCTRGMLNIGGREQVLNCYIAKALPVMYQITGHMLWHAAQQGLSLRSA